MGLLVNASDSTTDDLIVAWGRVRASGVEQLRSGIVRLPRRAPDGDETDWILMTDASFPARPSGANAVRLSPIRHDGELSEPRLTAPLYFARARLNTLLTRSGIRAVVHPFLFEAMPCAPLPTLAYGVADVPLLVVEWHWGPSFASHMSPFRGLVDVYDTVSVSVDGLDNNRPLAVHWTLGDSRDGLAPASRHIVSG